VKRFNTDALQEVDRSLGITGQKGAEETELQDGIVDQVLVTNDLIRRGRTLGISEGIFEGVIHHTHTEAETLVTPIAPYAVGTALAVPPYPALVPRGFDVWILKATVVQISGSGTFQGALFTNYDAAALGWSINDLLAADPSSLHTVVVNWNGLDTDTFVYGTLDGVVPSFRPFRLLRGTSPGSTITFSSTTSAAATFECQLLTGLFPTGLGQDVFV